MVVYRSFLTDLEATVSFEFYPFAGLFSPLPPPPSLAFTQRLCPRICRHIVIGRRFYDYYDFCCRPLLHNAALLQRLGLKLSFPRRRQRPGYSGHSPGKVVSALSPPTHLQYLAGLRRELRASAITATSPLSAALTADNPCPALRRFAFAWAATSARAFFRFRIGERLESWYFGS